MFAYLKDHANVWRDCEGCEDRAEIMGAGVWQLDALVIGIGVVVTLMLIYLKK
jgi:hypothetical protein